jgi:hypothetical protein
MQMWPWVVLWPHLAATGNGKILSVILADAPVHAESAMTAASIMAQNNVWYPYVEMADDPALKGLPAGYV